MLLSLADGGLAARPRASRLAAVVHAAIACGAVGGPALLAFAGGDRERWGFLLVANLVIVVWLQLRDSKRELGPAQAVTLAAALLVITHIPMNYFDGFSPRPFQWPAVRAIRQPGQARLAVRHSAALSLDPPVKCRVRRLPADSGSR